jgi:hypothetical protein
MSSIKENEILKTQFLVFHNIEHKIETDSFKASQYVQENLDLLKKYNRKDIQYANLTLATPVILEQVDVDNTNDVLYENITKLIFTERTSENIDTIVDAMAAVVEHIKTNKKVSIEESVDTLHKASDGLPTHMLSHIMVERYNSKYSALDESERKVLRALINSTDEQKKDVYTSTLKECLELVNEKLKESDLDTKERLLRVKEKLLNDKQEIGEDFNSNISKLVELRASLKDN